jgi:hypothetical protein
MSALSVLASTQNQWSSFSGGMTIPQFTPINTTLVTGAVATVVIPPSVSGQIISVPANTTGAVITLTLPAVAVAPGFNCKFILNATAGTGGYQADCGVSACHAFVVSGTNAQAVTAAGQYAQFTATGVRGDIIEVVNDGIRYVCKLNSTANAGVAAA